MDGGGGGGVFGTGSSGLLLKEPQILTVAGNNQPQSLSEEASHQQDSPQVIRLGGSLIMSRGVRKQSNTNILSHQQTCRETV